MERWHIIIVHYPIALLTISAVLWWWWIYRQDERVWWSFWLLFILGMLGAMAAVVTGEIAQIAVARLYPLKQEQVSIHEDIAYGSVLWYAGLFLWLLARRNRLQPAERWGIGIALTIGVGLLLIAAAEGGEIFH